MIRMLIDEVEKQHKRITFLEKKVKSQKAVIVSLEEVIHKNRSKRLVLRCTSNNKNRREIHYQGSGLKKSGINNLLHEANCIDGK